VETYCWLALPVAGCWVTAQGCVCRLCSDLNKRPSGSVSVTKCASEVSCTWDALYKSTSLPFFTFIKDTPQFHFKHISQLPPSISSYESYLVFMFMQCQGLVPASTSHDASSTHIGTTITLSDNNQWRELYLLESPTLTKLTSETQQITSHTTQIFFYKQFSKSAELQEK